MITVSERNRLARGHRFARSSEYAVRASALAHDGASQRSQQLASWLPFAGSADSDTLPELGILTSRSRDLTRNNGIAAGYVQTSADNIVGTGFRLNSIPDWKALKKSPEWAEEWARNTEALWRTYADSPACDAARRRTLGELTTLMFKSALVSGDALALPIWQVESDSLFATRLHILEADQLCNPQDSMDTTSRRGGIDIDRYGRHLQYHIRTSHPGDVLGFNATPATWETIPAVTSWGRKRVIFLGDGDRPGLTRSKSVFSAVLEQFKQAVRYSGAELDAAVANALIAAVIETPMDGDTLMEMFGGGAGLKTWSDEKGKAQNRAKLKSGAIVPLSPGERLASFNPSRPATGFQHFMEAILRHLATGLHLPYELLLKDFSKTNYSSARAALLEAWRYFKGRRQWLINNWLMPVYELWMEEAASKGLIEAPDFYTMRAAYLRSRWIGGGRGWVDPVKEAQAAALRIDAGLSTLEQECSEQGYDWEEIMIQRARELKYAAELGVESNHKAAWSMPSQNDPADEADNGDRKPGEQNRQNKQQEEEVDA